MSLDFLNFATERFHGAPPLSVQEDLAQKLEVYFQKEAEGCAQLEQDALHTDQVFNEFLSKETQIGLLQLESDCTEMLSAKQQSLKGECTTLVVTLQEKQERLAFERKEEEDLRVESLKTAQGIQQARRPKHILDKVVLEAGRHVIGHLRGGGHEYGNGGAQGSFSGSSRTKAHFPPRRKG